MNNSILIVEDSRTQAEALRAHLTSAGYDVTVARDGSDALDVLAGQPGFELVITDVMMPTIDGYELCRRIKARPELEGVPVILLTSLRDPVDIVRGLEAGADNFLTKPYEPERLLSRVDSMLQSRQRAPEEPGRSTTGAEVRLLGHHFRVDASRQQVLDLLMGGFEDLVYANVRLRDQEEELVHTREAAVAANHAKSRFVERLAHELRNPLGVISAYSTLLLEDELTTQQQKAMTAMSRSAERMLRLIQDLSDIEGIESGALRMTSEEVSIPTVVAVALEDNRRLAEQYDVMVRHHGPAGCLVVADEQRLSQVLSNLVSNAIKYNRRGGDVEVSWSAAPGQMVRVAVTDSGMGVAEEDMDRLFVPFDRLHTRSGIEGSGIGLPLVRELVEAMGGEMSVESELGRGSTFAFELRAPSS